MPDRQTNSSQFDTVAQSLEDGWQMPARLYADPHVFEIEQEAIFKKSWQFIGLLADLAKPGDYITGHLGNTPVFVVRASDGTLHGHVNACRHRLHPVALDGSGCKQLFQCRYHGWTYNPDGSLRSAPGHEARADFDKSALGLIPVLVDTFRGFVFANADSEAEDLDTFLGSAGQFADELDFNFTHWDRGGSFTYEIDADWKLFQENSLECYHCPLVHQNTFSAYIGCQPTEYITQTFQNGLVQHAPIQRAPNDLDVSGFKGFRFMFIWPCTGMSVDDFIAVSARLASIGPKRSRFVVDTFVKPGTDPEVARQWVDMYARTFEEDKEVVMAQQRGYDSGMVAQGRLMMNREQAIQLFQRRTWAALSSRLETAGAGPTLSVRTLLRQPSDAAGRHPKKAVAKPSPAAERAWECELEIASLVTVAEGVKAVTLVRTDGESLPAWQPGAHIDLILPNGMERQYSLCGDPSDQRSWRIAILREPQSRGGSAFIHGPLVNLSRVRVRGPRNHFAMPDAQRYCFVAGGIGITPILSMVRQAEREGKQWTLLYGGRSRDSMAFLDELEAYGDRVIVAPQDSHGLLDLATYLGSATRGTAVCACGPNALLDALASVCAGMPDVALHVERFTPVASHAAANTEFDLELRRSDLRLRMRKDQSVLDAIRDAGVTAYSSCRSGVCGTCETAVVEGVPDHRDSILSDQERAEGKSMMICVSRCKSERLVLDL